MVLDFLTLKKNINKIFLAVFMFVCYFFIQSIICPLISEAASFKAPQTNPKAGAINVCDYGMIGDGKFDNSGIFLNLISNYSSLYFPSGQYLIESEITVTKGVTLIGDSSESTALLFNGKSTPHNWNFRIVANNFSAYDISFKLKETPVNTNKVNIGSSLVQIDAANSCSFDSCIFSCNDCSSYFYTSVWIVSGNGPISNISFNNCSFRNDANTSVGGAFWVYGCAYPVTNINVNKCTFFNNCWDENIAIWSKNSIPLENITIKNCNITNINNIIPSDNIIAIASNSDRSSIFIENNNIIAEGLIHTSIKIRGLGKIDFQSNNIQINDEVDNDSSYGFLLILDAIQARFNNNIITLNQKFPARIKLNNHNQFIGNNISIIAKYLRFESDNGTDCLTIQNNDFHFSGAHIDISNYMKIVGGSITLAQKSKMFLPTRQSNVSFNNLTVKGDITLYSGSSPLGMEINNSTININ